MQRNIFTFPFFFFMLVLQLPLTSASGAAVISRARSRSQPQTRRDVFIDGAHSTSQIADTQDRNLIVNEATYHGATVEQSAKENALHTASLRNLQQHESKYVPKPNYKSYQPESTWTVAQKIGIFSLFALTLVLATYTCVLNHRLSTLNVYSLLGRETNTQEKEENMVGGYYGNSVQMI